MSVSNLLNSVARDIDGQEVCLRVIGARQPPAQMVIQIAISGLASVQIQGRITRDAPWQNLGPLHSKSTLLHIGAVQFLRAVASNVAVDTAVSVWADWAW